MATVKIGGRPSTEVSGGPKIEDVKITNGALHVANMAQEPGHDSTFDRTWGGPMAETQSVTADGNVGVTGPCIYYGYYVTTALSAAACNIRDATSAGTGTIIDIIAASAAAGTQNVRPFGTYCANGLYTDFGGTGTVTIFYHQL